MRVTLIDEHEGTSLVVASNGRWTPVGELLPGQGVVIGDSIEGLITAGPEAWQRLAAVTVPGATPTGAATLAPLVGPATRIFCVGRNYVEHAHELNNEVAAWPEVFLRFGSSVVAPGADIVRPSLSAAVDYEGELAMIIGTAGRHIPAETALSHVFGYTAVNDVSVRDWQRGGNQWTPGKNFDGTLPVGPWIVTADELDATDLALQTRVNGNVMQSARTSQFIFSLGEQIEFISSFTELRPGDLICTGTPGGVGLGRKPPVFLTEGDTVEVEIEGIGTLTNGVRDDGLAPATERWGRLAEQALGIAR